MKGQLAFEVFVRRALASGPLRLTLPEKLSRNPRTVLQCPLVLLNFYARRLENRIVLAIPVQIPEHADGDEQSANDERSHATAPLRLRPPSTLNDRFRCTRLSRSTCRDVVGPEDDERYRDLQALRALHANTACRPAARSSRLRRPIPWCPRIGCMAWYRRGRVELVPRSFSAGSTCKRMRLQSAGHWRNCWMTVGERLR